VRDGGLGDTRKRKADAAAGEHENDDGKLRLVYGCGRDVLRAARGALAWLLLFAAAATLLLLSAGRLCSCATSVSSDLGRLFDGTDAACTGTAERRTGERAVAAANCCAPFVGLFPNASSGCGRGGLGGCA